MTLWKSFLYMMAAMVVLTFVACGESEESGTQSIKEEAGEAVEDSKDYAAETKAEFTNQLKEQLDSLEEDIAALQARAQELSGEAKDTFQAQLDKLQDERAAVQSKLDELQQSSQDAWEEMKEEADQAWRNLKQQYQDLEASVDDQLQ